MTKTETVLNTLENTGNKLSGGEKLLFNALVEDSKKMEERMAKLEQKVEVVEKKVDSVISDQQNLKNQLTNTQTSIDRLSRLVEANINIQKERTKVLAGMLHNKWFWIFAIIAIILIAGGSAADLMGILKIDSSFR